MSFSHPPNPSRAETRPLRVFVLGSKKSSTYPRGYACGFFSPAALRGKQRVSARLGRAGVMDDHFEHPKRMLQGNEQWL